MTAKTYYDTACFAGVTIEENGRHSAKVLAALGQGENPQGANGPKGGRWLESSEGFCRDMIIMSHKLVKR